MSAWDDYMKQHGAEEYSKWDEALKPMTDRMKEQDAEIASLREKLERAEAALTEALKDRSEIGQDYARDTENYLNEITSLRERLERLERYQKGIGSLILRCDEALGEVIRGVDDADTLSQIFQATISEKQNDATEIRLLRERLERAEADTRRLLEALDYIPAAAMLTVGGPYVLHFSRVALQKIDAAMSSKEHP